MKNSILLVLLVLLFTSCSKNDSPSNTAPTVPSLVSPTNSKLCINSSVSFEWTAATDLENNPITYQFQIASDNLFTQIVKTIDGTALTQTVDLEKGKTYYWRVKATDSNNASSDYSATNNFLTEAVATSNHLPFSPQIVSPTNNSLITETSITLKWSASDADTADVLTYDVYLDTQNPPTTKLGTNLSTNSINSNTLLSNTGYYWYVVVKDNKGGETKGQVWYFKTN